MKLPSNLREVPAVIGLVGLYRKSTPGFGKASKPLYQLLKKNFLWTKECEDALQEMKKKLLSMLLLVYPNNHHECTLTTDKTWTGIGAIFTQKQKGVDGVIACASKTLTKTQRNCSSTKRELFAVVHFRNHFKTYLLVRKTVVVTDN